jgi:hypothetical protein
MELHTVNTPWLATHHEDTFLNRIKELNEPPVQTYKDLKLSPIKQNRYHDYIPMVYKRSDYTDGVNTLFEDFGGLRELQSFKNKTKFAKITKFVLIFLVTFLIFSTVLKN